MDLKKSITIILISITTLKAVRKYRSLNVTFCLLLSLRAIIDDDKRFMLSDKTTRRPYSYCGRDRQETSFVAEIVLRLRMMLTKLIG